MMDKKWIISSCGSLLGLALIITGLTDMFVWAGQSGGMDFGMVSIGGEDFFRFVWGSLILVFGGIMLALKSGHDNPLTRTAHMVLGAIMVWIIAGTDLFATLCENIPAGEESPEFFNSLSGFIGAFAPPYTGAVVLLPFSLILIWYLLSGREQDENYQ